MISKREQQLNDLAKQLGLVLIKSKAKRKLPDDRQQYRIVDISNVIQAGEKFDMSLDEVEKFLKEREAERTSEVNTASVQVGFQPLEVNHSQLPSSSVSTLRATADGTVLSQRSAFASATPPEVSLFSRQAVKYNAEDTLWQKKLMA